MPKNLEYGAATHVGLVRDNNEDCYLANPELGLWLIADGMGGHDAGEVASDIVKTSIEQSVRNKQALVPAIIQSHEAVKQAVSQGLGSPNMGTTVIALSSHDENYQISWVGDSRAYIWRPMEQSFEQISKDHSYVQSLFDAGSISQEEMDNHPQKNVITQCLGATELDSVQPGLIEGKWQSREKILLCSDGLTDIVSNDEIKHAVKKFHNKTDQELVDHLIELALEKGGVDNVTIEVISAPSDNVLLGTDLPTLPIKTIAVSALVIAAIAALVLIL
jgi:protein phosphatase